MTAEVRWKQRFQNFDRACSLLREALDLGVSSLSALEKEGLVQRFEFTVELAWKTLKDYLEHEGREVVPLTPRNVIKEAFAARILRDGQVWIDMIDLRNLLSHTYDEATFEHAVLAIRDNCYPAVRELQEWFQTQLPQT